MVQQVKQALGHVQCGGGPLVIIAQMRLLLAPVEEVVAHAACGFDQCTGIGLLKGQALKGGAVEAVDHRHLLDHRAITWRCEDLLVRAVRHPIEEE